MGLYQFCSFVYQSVGCKGRGGRGGCTFGWLLLGVFLKPSKLMMESGPMAGKSWQPAMSPYAEGRTTGTFHTDDKNSGKR